jgi:adenosylcobinamide-phosphate synthase
MALGFIGLSPFLAPGAAALAAAVILDLLLGDPVYPFHPIRLIAATLAAIERVLRAVGLDGYGGGVVLFLKLTVIWVGGWSVLIWAAARVHPWIAWTIHVFLVYSLLALGDLLVHVRRIESAAAAGDLARAHAAVAALVGRDTDRMDAAACRRSAVESLSENLTDGYTSPLLWYVLLGLPGLVLFKIVSTMDSIVGYKTPRYLRFGWCGARLDDVMNYVPARLTWMLITGVAAVVPGCAAAKAWRVGLAQHALIPSPNSGWSETATAGAIQRKLAGPIWKDGALVNEIWLGDSADPPLATGEDVRRAVTLVTSTGLVAAIVSCLALIGLQ